MHAASTIESINRDQLATASDRLLLRGRVLPYRPRTRSVAPPARGSSPAIRQARLAEGSQIVVPARRTLHPAPPVRASQPLVIGPTAREQAAPARRGAMPQASAIALAISPLIGFAVGLAAVL